MKRALVVGLNDYPYGLALRGCVNDAKEVSMRLEKHWNDDKNFDVNPITGECSRSLLKTAIKECFEGTAEVALFYFAGHGMIDAYGGHIVTTDSLNAELSLQDILWVVNESSCTNKVVILDSCFSGNMGNFAHTVATTIINEGVTILAACKRDQTAKEHDKHGVFTELLLAALDGEAADLFGKVTIGGVYAYIDKSLSAWEQRPVIKTNATTFCPLREVKPPIDVKILRNLSEYFRTSDEHYQLDPSYEFTNKIELSHQVIEPYALFEHTQIMKELQQLERVGLVVPCGTDHMYNAAMESKSCQLTPIGKHYWRLAKGRKV